ncbi:ATP-binding protein [Actinoplanes sp. CA-142083]|uniref:ATP-binding protein n=1 Tax=Actinoplanes sp. CA-142083 TaxID=3239903 RepID=UPI003D902714
MLVAVAGLGYVVSYRQETTASRARQAQRLVQAAQQVKYRVADFNGWQTAYAFDITRGLPGAAGDSSPSRAMFLRSAAAFDADLTALQALARSPDVARAVGGVRSAFTEFMNVDQEILRLYRSGNGADREAAANLVLGREIELYNLIAASCDAAVALSTSAADADFAHLGAVGGSTRLYIMALSAAAIALAVIGVVLAEARRRVIAEHDRQVQRMASLGQLAGGIAHDFNNLLSIILNYTAFAAEAAKEDETREDLAHVRTAAERAAGLTAQLLAFVRQEKPRAEVLDVNEMIAETHTLLARTIGEHINLVTVPSPTPLTISFDGGQIQQILVNLAVNARDAMPDGGTLVIAASAVDIEANQVDLRPELKPGRYVQVLVSDTGTGIPPDVAARIFEPFYTTKPRGRGTGLGLATVQRIVTGAGGSIDVCSKPGIGTTFRVYLPAVEPPDDSELVSSTRAPRGRGQRVLVVEDEPVLGASIARIVGNGGYRVRSAVSGPEAIAEFERSGCDLLLTDVVMPEMSGTRLAGILRQTHPLLPVLYVSGYTEGTVGAARLLEPEAVLIEKPFSANQLLIAVSDVLREDGGDRNFAAGQVAAATE